MFTFLLSLAAWALVPGSFTVMCLVKVMGFGPWEAVLTMTGGTLAWSFIQAQWKAAGYVTERLALDSVNQTFWSQYIVELYYKTNAFLSYAFNADQFVMGGAAVVIPQAGNPPTVIKNNTTYPMVAVQRGDTGISYLLDTYSTQPTFVNYADLTSISYNKAKSVSDQHFAILVQTAADDQLIKYATAMPGSNVISTTGPVTNVLRAGQTGPRNTFHHNDLKQLELQFNLANVPAEGRIALLSANHYSQLTDSLNSNTYRDFSKYYDASTGLMGKLYGFDIMMRSSVCMANAALSGGNLNVNALGQAVAATDNECSLAWQTNTLERAMGQIELFVQLKSPIYQADVMNTLIKIGGRVRRADYAGVAVIAQGLPNGN